MFEVPVPGGNIPLHPLPGFQERSIVKITSSGDLSLPFFSCSVFFLHGLSTPLSNATLPPLLRPAIPFTRSFVFLHFSPTPLPNASFASYLTFFCFSTSHKATTHHFSLLISFSPIAHATPPYFLKNTTFQILFFKPFVNLIVNACF